MADFPSRRGVLLLGTLGGLGALIPASRRPSLPAAAPPPPEGPRDWIKKVTRMGFGNPGEAGLLADAGVEVMHTNVVWPYYPLRRDKGGLNAAEAKSLKALVQACRKRKMKLSLGLPPFMPVALVKKHPAWRIHPDDSGAILNKVPEEKDLGTRSGCNLGPWGDYLIEVCAELTADYDLDGFSFDGNYHPPICYCPACKQAYKDDRKRDLPKRTNLDDVPYREYLVWRGERLIQHYEKLRASIRKVKPGAAIMTWTVNAGRYGHFLHSPRAMPVKLNRVIDLPMQEWWLDETNLGASLAPSFGAAYLRAVVGDGPCASEPYLMSRGNPYGTDSFPHHERLTRTLLALTYGNAAAHSVGWPGHRETTRTIFNEVKSRAPFMAGTKTLPWLGLLVSEQTRQFHAYADIAGRFLPPVFGAFRAAIEEHLPVRLITEDDLTPEALKPYRVLLLPGAVALSDAQVKVLRQFVANGGGLVASGETSLCDDLGRPRKDFALADLFGVSYRGRPAEAAKRPMLDENFKVAIDAAYWKERVGVARLIKSTHDVWDDPVLKRLVPGPGVIFRGPLAVVTEPKSGLAWKMTPEGWTRGALPGGLCRKHGKGRVVYLATSLDAALWSYAYPYQRRLLARLIEWAANESPPVQVKAPMCVQATYFRQGKDLLVHLFNGVVTTAHHGLPAQDVPLREETIPLHDLRVVFRGMRPRSCRLEPGGQRLRLIHTRAETVAMVPKLEVHAIVVARA